MCIQCGQALVVWLVSEKIIISCSDGRSPRWLRAAVEDAPRTDEGTQKFSAIELQDSPFRIKVANGTCNLNPDPQ